MLDMNEGMRWLDFLEFLPKNTNFLIVNNWARRHFRKMSFPIDTDDHQDKKKTNL